MLDIKIKKAFPDFHLDVDFNFPGGITALFGPSGSGKSLTLKCIAGLLKPDEGKIIVNNQTMFCQQSRINLSPQKRKIGFVFQNYALFPYLTVRENILFGAQSFTHQEKQAKLAGLLQMMGLNGLENKKPAELSGGQQQRVALARTLAIDPQLILLDEPFSALDSMVKIKLREELLDILQEQQVPAIIVTHDLNEAFSLSNFMVVIEAGKVIQSGDKKTVINQPVNEQVARLTRAENIFSGVVREISPASAVIEAEEMMIYCGPREGLKIGQAAGIVIRPHDIRLYPQLAGAEKERNTYQCLVKKIITDIDRCTILLQLCVGESALLTISVQMGREEFAQLKIGVGSFTACYLPPENISLIS